jgi:hypothetical protein
VTPEEGTEGAAIFPADENNENRRRLMSTIPFFILRKF